MPTIDNSSQPTDSIDGAIADENALVASWVLDRFAEKPVWLQRSLIGRAAKADIDLLTWYWTAPVQATGIHGVSRDISPGVPALFFVLDPQTEASEP